MWRRRLYVVEDPPWSTCPSLNGSGSLVYRSTAHYLMRNMMEWRWDAQSYMYTGIHILCNLYEDYTAVNWQIPWLGPFCTHVSYWCKNLEFNCLHLPLQFTVFTSLLKWQVFVMKSQKINQIHNTIFSIFNKTLQPPKFKRKTNHTKQLNQRGKSMVV